MAAALIVCLSETSPTYSQRYPGDQIAHASLNSDDLVLLAHDTNHSVRMNALAKLHRHAQTSTDTRLRNTVVDLFSQVCADGSAAGTGIVLEYLKSYSPDDFGIAARTRLDKLVRDDHYPRLEDVIRICAYLGARELIPRLQSLSNVQHKPAIRWSAIVGLVRLGDAGATSEMLRRVKRLPVGDDVVYRVLPDLAFTRHREAIRYLLDILNSNAENCLSPDPGNEDPIPCAYRVMELLAPIIKGFPFAIGRHGDLVTDDYPQALNIVRQWFLQQDDFEIITEAY